MEVSAPNAAPRRAAAGFSLIEAILASLILLVVALGVLPLFTRAMASNRAGADSTSLANMATAGAEELYQLPFDHPLLTVPAGATELVSEEVWTRDEERWMAPGDVAAGDLVLWRRRTQVRQFNINDILEGDETPLEGDSPAGSVHVKEIEVEVASTRDAGPLGGGRGLTVRLFKAQ